ncbi:MAG: aminoglycoside phosphotransferase family protein, partial [Rhizobiaceae bacterium]
DLACFLSPAMMTLYRRAPHDADAAASFLDAYPDRVAVARYRATAAAWHWRIACYCHYRAQELEVAEPETSARYRQALANELDFIEGLAG